MKCIVSQNALLLKAAESNFMALLTAQLSACDHDSPLTVQAPNFCTSLVSVECLVAWSTHAQKPKFAASPVKYACRKHRIPRFRKRQCCAYGKQSHEIRPFMPLTPKFVLPFILWVITKLTNIPSSKHQQNFISFAFCAWTLNNHIYANLLQWIILWIPCSHQTWHLNSTIWTF